MICQFAPVKPLGEMRVGRFGLYFSLLAEILLSFGSECLVRLPSTDAARSHKNFVWQSAAMQDSPPTLLLDHNPHCSFADLFFSSPTYQIVWVALMLVSQEAGYLGLLLQSVTDTMIMNGSFVSRKIATM